MSQIILYQNADGKIKVDVRFENETFWLTDFYNLDTIIAVGYRVN